MHLEYLVFCLNLTLYYNKKFNVENKKLIELEFICLSMGATFCFFDESQIREMKFLENVESNFSVENLYSRESC